MSTRFDHLPWDDFKRLGFQYRVDPKVIGATAMVESKGNVWAIRFEPQWRWNPPNEEIRRYAQRIGASQETVRNAMAMSWGPMQVMGAVAYEQGFDDWFTKLCGKEGYEHGVIHLSRKSKKYGTEPADIYAAYNAGTIRKRNGKYTNQANVDHFLRWYNEIKEARK